MRALPALCLLLASFASHAETPQQIRQIYAAEATAQQAGFTPLGQTWRGAFPQRFSNNDKMPACTSCHTDSPLNAGQHAITGKSVRRWRWRPMPSAFPIRRRWKNGLAATARKSSAAPARRPKRPILSPT
jgi:hypothetical protein